MQQRLIRLAHSPRVYYPYYITTEMVRKVRHAEPYNAAGYTVPR